MSSRLLRLRAAVAATAAVAPTAPAPAAAVNGDARPLAPVAAALPSSGACGGGADFATGSTLAGEGGTGMGDPEREFFSSRPLGPGASPASWSSAMGSSEMYVAGKRPSSPFVLRPCGY